MTRLPFRDIDHFEIVTDIGNVGGRNEKDVLRDPDTGLRYIAKLGRRNETLEVVTEYAIYVVGRLLGVSVASAKVGRYLGRPRFLSEYFLRSDGPEELVHGFQLFSELYDREAMTLVQRKMDQEQKMFSVQHVKAAFGAHYIDYGTEIEDELFGDFVAMLAHDALIGVMDRHPENWGVIVVRESGAQRPRFAPLYDSARGLFCNFPEPQLRRRFCRSAALDEYVRNARPLVGFDDLSPYDGKTLTHTELLCAIFKHYPGHRNRITSVLQAYDWKLVRDALGEELGDLCSPFRRSLMLVCLRRRLRSIWQAIDRYMK